MDFYILFIYEIVIEIIFMAACKYLLLDIIICSVFNIFIIRFFEKSITGCKNLSFKNIKELS